MTSHRDSPETAAAAAERVARTIAELVPTTPADRVLLVHDEDAREIATVIQEAVRMARILHDDLSPPASTLLTVASAEHLDSIAEREARRIDEATLVISILASADRDVAERIAWTERLLTGATRRVLQAPGLRASMLREGGPFHSSPAAMRPLAEERIADLADAATLRICTPAGTDLRLDLRDRPFTSDLTVAAGTAGNLPCGEVFAAPVECGADGIVVADATFGDLGVVPARSVRLRIRSGVVTRIECDDRDRAARVHECLSTDRDAGRIGEIGFGVNPGARFSGHILEDEKAAGTAHVAFGRNLGMPGGGNASRVHHDVLLVRPTLDIVDTRGRSRTVLRNGESVPSGLG